MVKKILASAAIAACVAGVLVVVIGGHAGPVFADPVRLWGRWLSGDKVGDDTRLWGWTMVAWGRTGKLLQFVAGLTVILDLMEKQLGAFGGRLRHQSWKPLSDRMRGPSAAIAGTILIAYLLSALVGSQLPAGNSLSRVFFETLNSWVGFVLALLTLGMVGHLLSVRWTQDQEQAATARETRQQKVLRIGSFLLTGALPLGVWLALTRGVLLPIVSGLVKVFDRPEPGRPLRWVAFFLFLIGFGLDLLAS
ncbi:hypothetical protein AB0L41_48800 [Amycolatopsis mediterranei]|uniref:hypothetical protein n=1 Tax=Amycolatopsis mediterranei TaxID=33910 RepID=UPI003424957A